MTPPLCLNPRCAIPRRHRDDCDGDQCRGCLPGWAADGLRLCAVCTRRHGENAVKAAELHGELELMLRPSGSGGQVTGKPGSASPPRDAVVAMRTEIRAVLASWCRFIAEERGIGLPDDEVTAMGNYLRLHGEWLAATEYAGEVADELASLASRAWGLAYPSGTRRIEVGPCPHCDGTLTAIVRATDQALPSEVACDADEAHRWSADRWRELDRLVMAKRRMAA
jgi:hypothetical protein